MTLQLPHSTQWPLIWQSAHTGQSYSARQTTCCHQATPLWWELCITFCYENKHLTFQTNVTTTPQLLLFKVIQSQPSLTLKSVSIVNKDLEMSSLTLPWQVVSGGVASNQYIRRTLSVITEREGLSMFCPPAKFCTDNGVMIAWWVHCISQALKVNPIWYPCCKFSSFYFRNGVERLREGIGILPPNVDVCYEPKLVQFPKK